VDNVAIYWDASAVLSALFKDRHSNDAYAKANCDGFHVLTSLAYSEVCAVIARMHREQTIPEVFVSAAFEALENGPWRFLTLSPDMAIMRSMSKKWPLRGADLWHLCTAVTLKKQIPELSILSYDNRLLVAAAGEGLN